MRAIIAARNPREIENRGNRVCSFCSKGQDEVREVIAGPAVFICDECVGLCNKILSGKAGQESNERWQAWKSMADNDLLATLPEMLKRTEAVRDSLQRRIDELRKRDVSWARIGEALNMSRQAAWERFA